MAKYTTYETSSLRILVLIFAARLASASSTPEAAESWLRRLQDRGRGLNCVVKFESDSCLEICIESQLHVKPSCAVFGSYKWIELMHEACARY